ncbi:MAG: S-adenosylmethionine decarboxylase [Gemmatimonadales bacterium]
MTFEHAFGDLGGVPGNRLSDGQALAALLLSAAGAAGLSPAAPPVVKTGPRGVAAVLLCHGGHVSLHALPDTGVCFVDVAGLGQIQPQRGLDIVVKRLGAREIRSDAPRRGSLSPPTQPERS